MQGVEAGSIGVEVVYKVDRLSRSLLDFAKVVDRFNRAGAAFDLPGFFGPSVT